MVLVHGVAGDQQRPQITDAIVIGHVVQPGGESAC
jgi:hypothetical protein